VEVEHIGHAGFIITSGDKKLVCDPWFNPAFLKSWFPWPDNRHHMNAARTADALYISHAHEDHFDREFLKTMPDKGIEVLVPRFRSRYLAKEIKELGFTNVKEMSHRDSYWLFDSLDVTMLIDQSHKEDSALLCEDLVTNYRFLNSNDCELAASDWPQGIDLLAAQYSGAFWYPHCYDYTQSQQVAKADEVVKNNIDRLCRRIKLTGAKQYLPSAGPAVFLDPELRHYNFSGIFPQFVDVEEEIERQCPDIKLHRAMHGGIYFFTDYLNDRRHEWRSWFEEDDAPAESHELAAHFKNLERANSRFMGDYRNDLAVYSGRDDWQIQLGVVEDELEESFDPHYFMNVPPRVLRAVLDGRATWETALLSNRIKLKRKPDKYDYKLMGLLSFGDRPAQTRAMHRAQRASETITRDGLILPKYCPHAGESLSIATICDGVIECPRHNWTWTTSGECITAQIPIEVRKSIDLIHELRMVLRYLSLART
jgi:UDP-MurNAc hydroxylase